MAVHWTARHAGRRRLLALGQNLLLALASSLLFLGLGEGAARLAEARRPARPVSPSIANWADWDDELFSAAGWRRVGDYYNRDGLRDREHAVSKPSGVSRLVFLGDSTTFGHGLDASDAYPQVLQRRLDARGASIEVFNAALPGWAARQQRLAYERLVRKYAPDVVAVAVCLNDVPDMQNNLTRPPAALGWLYRRSALVRRAIGAERRQIRAVEELFTQPPPARVRDGWERLFAELRALRAEVQADDARLALLVFPFRFQLEPGAPEPWPQRRLAQFAASQGLSFLDLLEPLRRHGPAVFLDEDHFTADGMRAVADAWLAWGVSPPAALPALPDASEAQIVAALASGEPARRLDAARRLARHVAAGGRLAQPLATATALSTALRSRDDSLRAAAAVALAQMGAQAQPAAAALLDALRDPSEDVRVAAADALVQLDLRAEHVAALAQLVADEQPLGDYEAVSVLGRRPERARAALPALTRALAHPSAAVRQQAAWALGEAGPAAAAAVPALTAALGDEALRWRAVDALGRIGPAAAPAVPTLVGCLGDAQGDVRRLAARTLGRIGPGARAATGALLTALDDLRPDVRLAAARALPRVAADPQRAVPALTRRLDDADDGVRAEAWAALRKLRRR